MTRAIKYTKDIEIELYEYLLSINGEVSDKSLLDVEFRYLPEEGNILSVLKKLVRKGCVKYDNDKQRDGGKFSFTTKICVKHPNSL
jgi:hypothetical protein